jgi:cytosine/adenosine deaminase-related metal-dependent hydrolase
MAVRRLLHAPIVGDAHAVFEPGALLLCGSEIEAVGQPQDIGAIEACPPEVIRDEAILPGMVNTHCHLDLSSLGPVSCAGGFTEWLKRITEGRATTPEAITVAMERGVRLAIDGGTVAVGDIAGAGSWEPFEVLADSVLRGRSYIEVFGIGDRVERGVEGVRAIAERAVRRNGVEVGVSPHAPYSCGTEVYEVAAASGLAIATHMAETLEELAFAKTQTPTVGPAAKTQTKTQTPTVGPAAKTQTAMDPFSLMLNSFGITVDGGKEWGGHPFDVASRWLGGRWIVAHATYPQTSERIERLAHTEACVAYCPRATAFFGHASHPWRAYLAAGVPVALGTDGLPCLETPERISVLDEIRWLLKHDGASLAEVLPMATTVGAKAVGLDPSLVDLQPGSSAGIIRVDVSGAGAPEWIVPPEGNSGR